MRTLAIAAVAATAIGLVGCEKKQPETKEVAVAKDPPASPIEKAENPPPPPEPADKAGAPVAEEPASAREDDDLDFEEVDDEELDDDADEE